MALCKGEYAWVVTLALCVYYCAGSAQSEYDGLFFFFFQAEDGIRDLVRSRGLGDVYKRQILISRLVRRPSPSFAPPNSFAAQSSMRIAPLKGLSLIHI